MSYIMPINQGYCPTQKCNACNTFNVSNKNSYMPPESVYIDCTDLYSQKEIKDILKRLGTQSPDLPYIHYAPRYKVAYYKYKETLVINNISQKNDTTEILKDGSVRHVGSWHNRPVAPAGTASDLIEDVKRRVKEAS